MRAGDPDGALSDEVCRIRFRGGAWQIVPIGPKGAVWLDGEVLDQPRALAFDAPFRVGSQWITLREHEDATPAVGHWSARRENWIPSHSHSPAATIEPLTIPIPAGPLGSEMAARHRSEWDSHAVDHDRLIQNQREVKRWESRMKAVGEKLRAGSVATATPAPPRVPVSEPHKTPLRRESVARRPEVSPPRTPRVPKAGRDLIERTSWRDQPTPRTPHSPTPEVEPPRLVPVEPPEAKASKIGPESYVESDAFALEIEAISALSEQTRHARRADVELIVNEADLAEIEGQTVDTVSPERRVRCADPAEVEKWSVERIRTESNRVIHEPESPDSYDSSDSDPFFRRVRDADHPSPAFEIEDGPHNRPYTTRQTEVLTAPHSPLDLE